MPVRVVSLRRREDRWRAFVDRAAEMGLEAGVDFERFEAVDGRPAKELKAEGFKADELWEAGFSAKELKVARFEAPLLRSVGFTAEEMQVSGFPLRELIRDAGFSAKELRLAGFTASDFLGAPCSITEMRIAGFSSAECLDCGLQPEVVTAIYGKQTVQEIHAAGFTCEQAKNGGLLPHECHQASLARSRTPTITLSLVLQL